MDKLGLLEDIAELRKTIKDNEQRLNDLENGRIYKSPKWTDKTQNGNTSKVQEDRAVRVIQYKKELEEEMARYNAMIDRGREIIRTVHNPQLQRLLVKRYILGMTVAAIAESENYSERQIERKFEKAREILSK